MTQRSSSLFSVACAAALTALPADAAVTVLAEYHLGEAGSLAAATNIPQDSSGNGRHFGSQISGGSATVGTIGVVAPGSTAYLDTTPVNNIGWYGADFSTLPTDNFAFGIYARSSTLQTGNTIIGLGNTDGRYKIHAGTNGWGASAHGLAWIGPAQGVSGSFTPDTWMHIAVVRDSGTTTLYLDGVAQSGTTGVAPAHSVSGHMTVNSGGGAYFQGQIDEARVVSFTAGESISTVLDTLQGVPEPSAAVLGGLGLLALLRRRSRS